MVGVGTLVLFIISAVMFLLSLFNYRKSLKYLRECEGEYKKSVEYCKESEKRLEAHKKRIKESIDSITKAGL